MLVGGEKPIRPCIAFLVQAAEIKIIFLNENSITVFISNPFIFVQK